MKKRLFAFIFSILLTIILITTIILIMGGTSSGDVTGDVSSKASSSLPLSDNYTITSPYAAVDWSSYEQYKTALHAHTTNSDGENTFSEMIEEHYKKDYDIVAITDHNVLTADWTTAKNGLTQARYDEIASGVGRGGRGMLQIPYSNEQSRSENANSFFTDYNEPRIGHSLEKNLIKVQELGGLSHINHPGRYTGGDKGGTEGADASNNTKNINMYVDLFLKYPSCVGVEIINKKDGDSASDRILWDNILMKTIPQNRYVWGFSNDDTHLAADTGFSFNMFVMPSNTIDNFKSTMASGAFYAVAKVSKRELGASFVGSGLTPVIKNIEVNETADSITITAENFDKIEWIADGKVIATGANINIKDHYSEISCYVRANISGPGGIAFTQPFAIEVIA